MSNRPSANGQKSDSFGAATEHWQYLQKLRALRKADRVVTILKQRVVRDLFAHHFHLLVRMHKISAFVVFDHIVADPDGLDVGVGADELLQHVPERSKAERKATSVAFCDAIKRYFSHLSQADNESIYPSHAT